MSVTDPGTGRASVCGVSEIGSHVVRTPVARRVLGSGTVAVLQFEAALLGVAVDLGLDERVAHRQEDGGSLRVHVEAGLVEPDVCGDRLGSDGVVAQCHLDEGPWRGSV